MAGLQTPDIAWPWGVASSPTTRDGKTERASHQFARDPFRDRAMPGRPAENFGGGGATHPAVGAERERRLLAAPGLDRRFGRPGLRRAETQLYCHGLDLLSQRFLAVPDINEDPGR